MADKKISELDALTGATVATDDRLVIVDTSAGLTKSITIDEFKNALDTATGFVRITGDTMTGDLDIQGTLTSDGLTVGNATDPVVKLLREDATTGVGESIGDVQFWTTDTSGGGNTKVRAKIGSTITSIYNAADLTLYTGTSGGGLASDILPRLHISEGGDISFYEDTGTTAKFFWDASAESLGIGTDSPSAGAVGGKVVHVQNSGSTASVRVDRSDASTAGTLSMTSGNTTNGFYGTGAKPMVFFTDSTERMIIDSSGNVGIACTPNSSSSGVSGLSIGDGAGPLGSLVSDGASNTETRLGHGYYFDGSNYKHETANVGVAIYQQLGNNAGAQHIWFSNAGGSEDATFTPAERMRIDSSGTLLVGKTTDTQTDAGHVIFGSGAAYSTRNGFTWLHNRLSTDGEILLFQKDGAPVGSIGTDNSGDLFIGNDDTGILFAGGSDFVIPWNPSTPAARDDAISLGGSSHRFKDLYLSGSIHGDTIFENNAGTTEYARFDSSGNLLVGKTSTSSGSTVDGVMAINDGRVFATTSVTTSTEAPFMAARTSTAGDGKFTDFKYNGTAVGSIKSRSSGGNLQIDTVQSGIDFGGDGWLPLRNGSFVDNDLDVGSISYRFDDIYATNGTIQTSDQNEKQQIASLTDAEMAAAKAISALFKTFKWNDSVAEKGDAARTHTGVIAQEVEQAMTDAGLNAGDYAFFISSDWTDEETGEERNRKGIRYPQLMSFIGAATEQRLASIEARLDALEGV